MSQKPKAGVPARAPTVAPREVPREAVVKTDPTEMHPVAQVEQTGVETVKTESTVETEPAAQSVAETGPVAAAVPDVTVSAPTSGDPSYSVRATLAAASDFAAASAQAVPATITATADTVAAVTAETVATASSIQPTKPTITQGLKTMMKSTEDFVAFGQANLEAFVKSGQIWSAGVQELTKQIATSAKASFEESVSTFKAISTAKSVKEAMDLQSSFAKAALEKAMAESNKLTDASIKLTEQTLAPITARVTVAVETFGKAA